MVSLLVQSARIDNDQNNPPVMIYSSLLRFSKCFQRNSLVGNSVKSIRHGVRFQWNRCPLQMLNEDKHSKMDDAQSANPRFCKYLDQFITEPNKGHDFNGLFARLEKRCFFCAESRVMRRSHRKCKRSQGNATAIDTPELSQPAFTSSLLIVRDFDLINITRLQVETSAWRRLPDFSITGTFSLFEHSLFETALALTIEKHASNRTPYSAAGTLWSVRITSMLSQMNVIINCDRVSFPVRRSIQVLHFSEAKPTKLRKEWCDASVRCRIFTSSAWASTTV